MKFAFLAGGFAGFALAALAGFSADRDADLILRDAAIGCLIGAVLFRWFWSMMLKALFETATARRAAAANLSNAAAAAPEAETAKTKTASVTTAANRPTAAAAATAARAR